MGKQRYSRKQHNRKYDVNLEKNKTYEKKFELIINIRNLLNDNKLPFAYANIMNYIEEYGEDCYIIHEYGKYLFMNYNLKESREQFLKNINGNSVNKYYSMYELSKLERFLDNYDEAIDLLKQILKSDHKEKYHAKFELAKVYLDIGKIDESKEIFNEILNSDGKEEMLLQIKESVWRYLLKCELESKNCDKALLILDSYKEQINSCDYDMLKSEIEVERKDFSKAKELLENILVKYPHLRIRALHFLSLVEYGLMDYLKTIEVCNQLMAEGNYYFEDTLVTQTNAYIKLNYTNEAFNNIRELAYTGYVNTGILLTGKLYFYINNYEKAIDYLSKVENKKIRVYREALYLRICSYNKLKRYQEAYDLLPALKETDYNNSFRYKRFILKCFLEKQLNITSDIETNNYSALQIMNYDKEFALNHIKKHEKEDDEKIVHTVFNENINIEELYEYCYNSLNENTFVKNSFLDNYIIPFENVGTLDGKTVNYVKVVVIPNTKDILSIYPHDKLIYPTLNLEKSKRLSRVDKFNKKYGIK